MREKILIIQTNSKALARQQRSFYRKYDVVIVNNVHEALEKNHIGRHFVIIYVLDGPDDREFRLLRKLKEQNSLERPIIVITKQNNIEIERAIASIGVYYHLLMPFDPGTLTDLVKSALHFWKNRTHFPCLYPCNSKTNDKNHEH